MNTAAWAQEIESRVARMPVRNTAALRTLRRAYSKRMETESAQQVVEIAAALIARQRVPRFIADELISSRPDALATLDRTQLENMASGISTWSQVDCFACYLSGPAWREGYIEDNTVLAWAKSDSRWWRRAALVSTIPLNVSARGGRGDARRTLRVCNALIDDRDEMVAKALSWALRALVQRDPDAVQRFIRENETRLPALVRREVRHKLETGRKSPKSK